MVEHSLQKQDFLEKEEVDLNQSRIKFTFFERKSEKQHQLSREKLYVKHPKFSQIKKISISEIKLFSNSTTSLTYTYFPFAVIILGAMLVSILILIIIRALFGSSKAHLQAKAVPTLDRDEDHAITRLDIVKYFLIYLLISAIYR